MADDAYEPTPAGFLMVAMSDAAVLASLDEQLRKLIDQLRDDRRDPIFCRTIADDLERFRPVDTPHRARAIAARLRFYGLHRRQPTEET